MKRVSRGYFSALCVDQTAHQWQEEVVKLIIEVLNFNQVLVWYSHNNVVKWHIEQEQYIKEL